MGWQENAHLKFARIVQAESGLLVYSQGKNNLQSNHCEFMVLSSISKECRATDGGMGSILYLGIAYTFRKSCICTERNTEVPLPKRISGVFCALEPLSKLSSRVGIFPLTAVGIAPLTSQAWIRPLEIFFTKEGVRSCAWCLYPPTNSCVCVGGKKSKF